MKELASVDGRPPVEPEGELVEIMVQLLAGHAALVRTEQPAFEQGGNSMYPGQNSDRSLLWLTIEDRPPMVVQLPQPIVTPGPVRGDGAAFPNAIANETLQALPGRSRNPFEPDSSHPFAADFDGDDDDIFADVAMLPAPVTSHHRLVYLDRAGQLLSTRPDHGSAQFVEHRPRGPVASQSQRTLKAQGADTALLVRCPPDRPEPDVQRQFAALEDGPSKKRDVLAAVPAMPQTSLGRPSLPVPASSALDTLRPTQPEKITAARFFRTKPALEFEDGPGILMLHQHIL